MTSAEMPLPKYSLKSWLMRGTLSPMYFARSLSDGLFLKLLSMKNLILSYIKKAYDVLNDDERVTLFRIADKVTASFQQLNSKKDQDQKEQNQIRKIAIE